MIVARIDSAIDVLRERGLVDADKVVDLLLDIRGAAQLAEDLLNLQVEPATFELVLPGLADL